MSDNQRLFPYKKAIVLNALYDALDVLSFVIDSSNSARGTLVVSSTAFPEKKGRVAISPVSSEKQTLVEVFTDNGNENQSDWIDVLLDEAQSLISLTGMREST